MKTELPWWEQPHSTRRQDLEQAAYLAVIVRGWKREYRRTRGVDTTRAATALRLACYYETRRVSLARGMRKCW